MDVQAKVRADVGVTREGCGPAMPALIRALPELSLDTVELRGSRVLRSRRLDATGSHWGGRLQGLTGEVDVGIRCLNGSRPWVLSQASR